MSAKLKTSFVHGPKISLFYHELLVVVLEASPGVLLVGEALDGDHGPPVAKVARSLPFLGLRQGGGCGGTIQGKEGIKFCSVA